MLIQKVSENVMTPAAAIYAEPACTRVATSILEHGLYGYEGGSGPAYKITKEGIYFWEEEPDEAMRKMWETHTGDCTVWLNKNREIIAAGLIHAAAPLSDMMVKHALSWGFPMTTFFELDIDTVVKNLFCTSVPVKDTYKLMYNLWDHDGQLVLTDLLGREDSTKAAIVVGLVLSNIEYLAEVNKEKRDLLAAVFAVLFSKCSLFTGSSAVSNRTTNMSTYFLRRVKEIIQEIMVKGEADE